VGGPFWLLTPGAAPRAQPYSPAAEGFAVSPRLVAFGTDCANPSTAAEAVLPPESHAINPVKTGISRSLADSQRPLWP
jgi:hypothetical protein